MSPVLTDTLASQSLHLIWHSPISFQAHMDIYHIESLLQVSRVVIRVIMTEHFTLLFHCNGSVMSSCSAWDPEQIGCAAPGQHGLTTVWLRINPGWSHFDIFWLNDIHIELFQNKVTFKGTFKGLLIKVICLPRDHHSIHLTLCIYSYMSSPSFFHNFTYLLAMLGLCCCPGFPLAAGGYTLYLWCMGFSLWSFLLLQSSVSRHSGV